jgi:hypothetical protein
MHPAGLFAEHRWHPCESRIAGSRTVADCVRRQSRREASIVCKERRRLGIRHGQPVFELVLLAVPGGK